MDTTPTIPARTLLSRARGALLGAAIGDALAFPNLHYSRTFLQSFAEPLAAEFVAPHTGFHPQGQYGAATQVMQAVAASIAESGDVSWDSLVSHMIPLWRDHLLVGEDPSATEAMEPILRGAVHRGATGLPPGRAEAAPATRVPAIAVLDHRDFAKLAADVALATRITHRDPRPAACAAAAAAAIASNLVAQEFILGDFLDRAAGASGLYDPAVEEAILDFPRILSQTERRALRQIASFCPDSRYPQTEDGLGEYCVTAVLTAIYYFLRSPHSYEQTVEGCLRLGGHIDVPTFLAGAMSGALVGDEEIPPGLVTGLLNAERIALYADHILDTQGRA